SDPVPVENPLLEGKKPTTSTPANGTAYAVGETITYTITVTNTGNVPVIDIVLKDDKTGQTFTVGTLQPGKSYEVTTVTYTVTETDAAAGSVTNTAIATGKGPNNEEVTDSDSVTDKVRTYGDVSGLSITKVISVDTGAGEEVTAAMNADTFSFTVTGPTDLYTALNNGNTTGDVSVSYEIYSDNGTTYVTNGTAAVNSSTNSFTISGVTNGQTVIVTTKLPTGDYTVTEAPDNSSAANTYSYTVSIQGGSAGSTASTSATETLTNGGTVSYTATNTPDMTTVTVTKSWVDGDGNALASSLIPVSLTVSLSGTAGSGNSATTYSGSATLTTVNSWTYTFTSLPNTNGAGETYTYTVSETVPKGFTAASGSISGSTVTVAAVAGTSGYTAELVNEKDSVDPEDPEKTHMATTVASIVNGTETQTVAVGTEITYTISYYNNNNTSATVTVTDTLPTGLEYVSSQVNSVDADPTVTTTSDNLKCYTWTITNVAPFTSGTVTVVVKVTEDAGSDETGTPTLTNTATVQIGNATAVETTDTVSVHNPKLSVTKTVTSTPASLEGYALGETITYTITVKNTGNVDLYNITVEDELVGKTNGSELTYAGSLAPDASTTFDVEYAVTADDVAAGTVTNAVTAEAVDTDGEEVTDTADVTVDTREYGAPGGLTITKTISVSSGDVTDEMNADTFTFTVTGPTDLYTSLNRGGSTGDVTIDYTVSSAGSSGSEQRTTTLTSGSRSFTISGIKNGETVTITTALPTGSYTVTETTDSGNTYTYTVRINDGISAIGTASASATLEKDSTVSYTATNVPETTTVSVTKVWNDNDDAYGLRPTSVTVYVKNGTDIGDTLTISGSTWTATSKNLPKYDSARNLITYTVEEESVSGYNTSYTTLSAGSYQITNTLDAGSLTITKNVVSPNTTIASDTTFTVRVYGFTSASAGKTVTAAVKNSDGSSGTDISGTVTKDTGTTGAATGTTNYYVEFTLLAGQTLTLSSLPVGSYTVVETGTSGSYSWTTTYDAADGIYTVTTGDTAAAVITNTITGTVVLNGTKTWNDGSNLNNSHDNASEIVLKVSRKSAKADSKRETLTEDTDYVVVWDGNSYKIYASSSSDGNSGITYTELPKYDSGGYLYTYTVSEEINSSYVYTTTSSTSGDGLTTDFTNTIQNPGKAVKVENGGTCAAVGDILTYTIVYKNFSTTALGEFTIVDTLDSSVTYVADSYTVVNTTADATASLSVGTGSPTTLTWTISGLGAGEMVTVTFQAKVTSVPAGGSIENTAVANGFDTNTVTTPVSQITISGTKTWEDSEDTSARPTYPNLTIYLLENDSTAQIETQRDDSTDSYYIEWTQKDKYTWTYTISNVPKYDSNGDEITYTVVEEVPDGYTASSETETGETDSDGNVTEADFTNTYQNPSKKVDQTSAAVGDTLTYTITYYNNSDDTLTSVEIIDDLDTNVKYLFSTVKVDGTEMTPTPVSESGATVTWTV
ncbi:MAG: Cna B-type domain-containing protein, partial [Lachnospiraceae bacterium]|nr:Cna B-type domain-containing protein [Lachnospiraceae bacterium]